MRPRYDLVPYPMPGAHPNVYVLGGPNGAGKSTSARALLSGLGVANFLNADTIARGLSAGSADARAVAAGREFLRQVRDCGRAGVDFAFETTMASRRLEAWLRELAGQGYHVHLLYLWVASPELALDRVRARTRAGGHAIPEATVRRRYARGLRHFLALTGGDVDGWALYDNTTPAGPRPVASGGAHLEGGIHDDDTWRRVLAAAGA